MAQECAKVPVVNVSLDRLKKMLPRGVKAEKALEMLPFVGLDIEGIDGNIVRVEYNPNRPDFSSDYGIARALAGLLGVETGMPRFRVASSPKGKTAAASIKVDRAVKKVRPHIVALVAKGGNLDDETIKQLIAMQEDLHNGIGRRRKKASIGMHNLDAIKFPVRYTVADSSFSFAPLGGPAEKKEEMMTVEQILKETDTGRSYGHLLADCKNNYPVIIDSAGTVLSLPPIINGEATRVDTGCRNLFVEVTATDAKAAQDALAVIAITLYDAGFTIQPVTIDGGSGGKKKTMMVTPDVRPAQMRVDVDYVNAMLGLALSAKEMVDCLEKCRLDARAAGKNRIITCTIPRYRVDITHPIDLVEEVAIGYGIYNIEPSFPPSPVAGERLVLSTYFDAARQAMTGMGMLEAFNSSLAGREVIYDLAGRKQEEEGNGGREGALAVDGSKSAEHEVLRDSLLPQLLQSLSRNVHEEYPQKLFEIGKTFRRTVEGGGKIDERWSIAAVIAHGEAGYTEAKSALQALLSSAFGIASVTTEPSSDPLFIDGRCASITTTAASASANGKIGEVRPQVIENFKLRVPVAAFELDLSAMLTLSP